MNTPGNTQTADLVGNVTKIGEIGADGYYFDPAAWAQPEGVRFGTGRINQFRGPGGWNLDFSVFRSFPLGGTRRIEARVEAANVTNTFKFGNPTGNLHERRFHAHLRALNAVVCGTAGPARRSVQLLSVELDRAVAGDQEQQTLERRDCFLELLLPVLIRAQG